MKIARGDSKTVRFQRISNETGEVITKLPLEIYFTMKDTYMKQDYIFQKTLENGIVFNEEDNFYYLTIEPKDTDGIPFGTYDYDIQVVGEEDYKHTVTGTIQVTKEVTWVENEVK